MSRLQTHSINKGGNNCVYSSDQLNQIVNKGRTLGCRSHQSDCEDRAERLSHLCSQMKTQCFRGEGVFLRSRLRRRDNSVW